MALLLFSFLFGCHHKKRSRVWLRRSNGKRSGHYQTCLNCGAEIPYNGPLSQN